MTQVTGITSRRLSLCASWVFVILVLLFLLIPLVVVVPVSFTPGTVVHFPPDGLSLRWYRDFFGDSLWRDAAWLSLRLAVCVAITSTCLGLFTAFALVRCLPRGHALVRGLTLAPLVVPLILVGIAIFDVALKFHLARSFTALLIAHTILAIPFTTLVIESGLRRTDPSLEDAARSLGAGRVRAIVGVTLPAIKTSLFAGALFGFLTSWDELVVVLFVGGASYETLPLRMFEFLQTQIRPTLAAVSTLLILLVIVIALMPLFVKGVIRQFRRMRRATN